MCCALETSAPSDALPPTPSRHRFGKLTEKMRDVLKYLLENGGGKTQRTLAEDIGCSRGTVAQTMKPLEANGAFDSEHNLLPAGRQFIDAWMAYAKQLEEERFPTITEGSKLGRCLSYKQAREDVEQAFSNHPHARAHTDFAFIRNILVAAVMRGRCHDINAVVRDLASGRLITEDVFRRYPAEKADD